MEAFKTQQEIRNSCEEVRNSLLDLTKWEKEMKEKEKLHLASEENKKIPQIRSLNKQPKKSEEVKMSASTSSTVDKMKIEKTDSKTEAETRKEKGNYHVKIGEYTQAIECYTDAIRIYHLEPNFYTNRALCYLKLERYLDCIEDCNRALKLNPKTVKAYYRRMQAYEFLGEKEKALIECEKILEIEPKSSDAIKSLERIKKKLETEVNRKDVQTKVIRNIGNKPSFSELGQNMRIIKPINKPAHLRSKKSLKKIPISETIGSSIICAKDSKNVENSSIASSSNGPHISDEVLDKLFNSNEYNNFKQVYKNKTPAIITELNDEDETCKKSERIPLDIIAKKEKTPPAEGENIIPPQSPTSIGQSEIAPSAPPQTTREFYVTWKELSDKNKYLYLRSIEISKINKILGAGLDSETLSTILKVLSEEYIKNEVDVHKILSEISKNSEITILSMLLSEEDQNAMKKLITYMRGRKDSEDDILSIQKKFGIV